MFIRLGRHIIATNHLWAVHSVPHAYNNEVTENLELYVDHVEDPRKPWVTLENGDLKNAWESLHRLAANKEFVPCGNWIIRAESILEAQLGDRTGDTPADVTIRLPDQKDFRIEIDRPSSLALAGHVDDLLTARPTPGLEIL